MEVDVVRSDVLDVLPEDSFLQPGDINVGAFVCMTTKFW